MAGNAFVAAMESGQSASGREWPVGATTRRFVPQGAYNWRGAAAHALVTTLWYPAAPGIRTSEHNIGPPESPLFRLGEWADNADPVDGRFPLIVLSHGTGGSAQMIAWLGRALASKGYIAAAVNHPGNNAMEEYTPEGFLIWWERARDLTTVIEMLVHDRQFGRLIDQSKIGAAGFSLGGYTAIEIAGGRTDPALFRKFCRSPKAEGCADPPEFPDLFERWAELNATNQAFRHAVSQSGRSYRDPRIRAVFAIAPALGPAFIPDSLRRITTPVAIVAGSDDSIVPVRSNAQLMANLVPRANLTLLPGVGHYTFLAACTEHGRRARPELCTDARAVEREAVHQRTAGIAARFFDKAFR
jgi:predicted dienelactone hydrolase